MNADNSQFCRSCGHEMGTALPAPDPAAQTAVAEYPPPPPRTSGKAIASLIFGFFSLLLPAAIVAIILGHISHSEIRKSNGRITGNGLAIGGLVLGYLGVAMIPILIIAAIAIPNLLRSRIAANEASAVGSLRTINTAERAYQGNYPNAGFACDLSKLAGDGSSPDHAGFIDNVLATGHKSGYRFELSCDSDPSTYIVVAYPITANQSGTRAFCTNQTGIISYSKEGTAEACLRGGEPLQ
jgi:type II secretory pathway pseudopilin PulG